MTYTELKAAIAAWMHRNDLSANADTFIDMVEARANRNLRSTYMEKAQTVTASAVQALPANWLGFKSILYNGAGYSVALEFASSQKIASMGLSGLPVYYTINGGNVEFSPTATGAEIEWTFYESIPPLTDANQSNWLLARHPDYYLMGCIQQARVFALKGADPQIEMVLQGIEAQVNRAARTAMSGPLRVVLA